MPIVACDSHTEIERVEGLVLDISETHVTALVVEKDDRSLRARVVPLYGVVSFGDSSIEVASKSVIHAVDQLPDIRKAINRSAPSTTHLLASDGTEMGAVNDIVFNENTGDIQEFEAFTGTTASMFSDYFALPLYDELDDGLIAHTSSVNQLIEHERRMSSRSKDSAEQWILQAASDSEIFATDGESTHGSSQSSNVSGSIHDWTISTWNFLNKVWHDTTDGLFKAQSEVNAHPPADLSSRRAYQSTKSNPDQRSGTHL